MSLMRAASAGPIEVRVAEAEDLPACLALDDSYTTSFTWQVEVIRGEPGSPPYPISSSVTLGETPVSVTFRPVKLPRPRKIAGPIASGVREGGDDFYASRLQAWGAADLVLVAHQADKLCGYLVMTVVPGSGIGWISSLVVANSVRRKGVGSMLMSAARRWSRYGSTHVRAFMLELPTRNYPGIAFCRSEGFHLCGYTDYAFSNGELVLMFVSQVII
jgi:ribosomal protein S18 acetylase RimI-like enzyme